MKNSQTAPVMSVHLSSLLMYIKTTRTYSKVIVSYYLVNFSYVGSHHLPHEVKQLLLGHHDAHIPPQSTLCAPYLEQALGCFLMDYPSFLP